MHQVCVQLTADSLTLRRCHRDPWCLPCCECSPRWVFNLNVASFQCIMNGRHRPKRFVLLYWLNAKQSVGINLGGIKHWSSCHNRCGQCPGRARWIHSERDCTSSQMESDTLSVRRTELTFNSMRFVCNREMATELIRDLQSGDGVEQMTASCPA